MSVSLILSARRTPIGKFQGALGDIPAAELGAIAIDAALTASAVDRQLVDDVIMGMVLPAGAGQAPARQAAIKAGIPSTASALTVNKVCGSGLQSVMLASQAIRCCDASLVVAGGMENMSQAPWLIPRQLRGLGNQSLIDSMSSDGLSCAFNHVSMGEYAEALAEWERISREELDAFAVESHRRAIEAREQGHFQGEIVPLSIKTKFGSITISHDEGPRLGCSLEQLSKLRPAFRKDGAITAGNSAMISDGAAAVVVASDDFVHLHGLTPIAEIVASTTAGLAPEDLFVAPVDAINKLLSIAKRGVQDIDLWEINEAFAVQMIACQRALRIPSERLNVHGGAIALGHPIGTSGARILTTLLHSLQMQGKEWGVASLCLGGGNAVAMLVKRIT